MQYIGLVDPYVIVLLIPASKVQTLKTIDIAGIMETGDIKATLAPTLKDCVVHSTIPMNLHLLKVRAR